MNQPQNQLIGQDGAEPESDHEIDLLGLIQTLGEEKRLLFVLPFFCACIAAAISLYLPPIYTAKATFVLPDKQSSSASAVLDQIGSLGGLAGGFSKSPTEMYVALMQSNTVLDVIISEFDLIQRYQTKTQEETRKRLLSVVKIATDKKSGFISIEAQDQSPEIATKLANAYLKPFREVLNRMSLEEAHQRRDFFYQQIGAISQRPFRDPFVQSTLMNAMIKQYEAARIDEARESQILFQVDIAKIPQKKSPSKTMQLSLFVCFSAFFTTILWIFVKRRFRYIQSDPASAQKLAMIKKAWKL